MYGNLKVSALECARGCCKRRWIGLLHCFEPGGYPDQGAGKELSVTGCRQVRKTRITIYDEATCVFQVDDQIDGSWRAKER